MKGMRNAACGMRHASSPGPQPMASDPVSSIRHSSFRLPPSDFRLRRGFTLLEVIMALLLMAMISGMVFGIMRTALRTAVETGKMQVENDEVSRFIMLCRHTLQNLPSTAILTLTITETGDPVQQELTISSVPEAFAFGPNPMSYKDSILGMRPDLEATEVAENGERIYYIGLSREDLIPTDPTQSNRIASTTGEGLATPDDQGRYWMPLLANVTSVSWRFYKEDEDLWKEEWDATDLPQLVEMNLLLHGRTVPLRSVFSLPSTKLTGANPALAPRTSTPSTTASSQQTGGGNNGGGDRGGGDRRGGDRGSDKGKGGDMGGDRGGPKGGGRGPQSPQPPERPPGPPPPPPK